MLMFLDASGSVRDKRTDIHEQTFEGLVNSWNVIGRSKTKKYSKAGYNTV